MLLVTRGMWQVNRRRPFVRTYVNSCLRIQICVYTHITAHTLYTHTCSVVPAVQCSASSAVTAVPAVSVTSCTKFKVCPIKVLAKCSNFLSAAAGRGDGWWCGYCTAGRGTVCDACSKYITYSDASNKYITHSDACSRYMSQYVCVRLSDTGCSSHATVVSPGSMTCSIVSCTRGCRDLLGVDYGRSTPRLAAYVSTVEFIR